jgi:predicted nucleic acid-binding Zn ribbon protein
MERISAEVARKLRRFGPVAGMADLVAAWPRAVGEGIARHAWPARLARDGTLHVATDSSTWAFELAQLAPTLLTRLREEAGEATPTALRFAVGALPEPAPDELPAAGRVPVEPTDEERSIAAGLVARIEDAELRELVARAAAASLARAASEAASDR